MQKLLAIAQREFAAMVATKAFLLTLIMMPILMFGGLVLLPTIGKLGGRKERRIIVADQTGSLFDLVESQSRQRNEMIESAGENGDTGNDNPFEAAEIWNFESWDEPLSDDDRLELSDQIRDGKLYAFVEIPASMADKEAPETTAFFVSQDAALSGARRWLENTLKQEIRGRRLTELGIDPQLVMQANVPIQLEPTMPYKEDGGEVTTKGIAGVMTSMFLPFGIMMLMFLVIFLAAQPMLESGMEEKSGRIAELLLGSVSPTQLMTGKLLGNVAGSFVVFAFYGIGGFIVVQQNDWAIELPWTLMPWLIVFQVLGVLFFSSIFLTIGASVSELKEAQSLLLPVWLTLMVPMMVWFVAVRDPNGVVAVTLSFFPPSTPLMMSLRMSSGQTMPFWHAPLAAVVMLAATYAVVVIAGRIYRASLLKSDSAKTFVQLYRRLRAAE